MLFFRKHCCRFRSFCTQNTLSHHGRDVFLSPDLPYKVSKTIETCRQWFAGGLPVGQVPLSSLPSYPGRPDRPEIVDIVPSFQELKVPPAIHLLHALAHIELTAVDMYWDTMLRAVSLHPELPREFFDDFVKVVGDEARHFGMVSRRLQELGSYYGALPAHRLLWNFGVCTADDLAARMALVPLVQEARGLDAGPRFLQRLSKEKDTESLAIVKQIVEEEVLHVNMGVKWFTYLSHYQNRDPGEYFRELVMKHIPTGLSPPFNEAARNTANFPKDWYLSCQPASPPSAAVKPIEPKRIVLIFSVFPEFHSTAAGVRSTAIVQCLHDAGHSVTVISPGRVTEGVQAFESLGVRVERRQPNDQAFDELIASLEPQVVVFDRFMMEEQFAWRVRRQVPQALFVLDTQDLHFLRHARELEVKRTSEVSGAFPKFKASDEQLHRELACIHRSDLVLLVSSFELELLDKVFRVDPAKLALCTFFYPSLSSSPSSSSSLPSSPSASFSAGTIETSSSSATTENSHSSETQSLHTPSSSSTSTPTSPPLTNTVTEQPTPTSAETSQPKETLSSAVSKQPAPPLFFPSTTPATSTASSSSWQSNFSARKHFVTIGNFYHKPNVDAIAWLKECIWPLIRQQLPTAEMHVYGAYAQQKHLQLSHKASGFLVLGHAPDQFVTIAKHRALLAPLRFGAGIKGKIADAWFTGTPVVSTSIGAESMGALEDFGGFVEDDPALFARAAIRLYEEQDVWHEKQSRGQRFVQQNYDWNISATNLVHTLDKACVSSLRSVNFMGAMLQGETLRTTEYLSKYIEQSNKLRKLQAEVRADAKVLTETNGSAD